MKKVILIALFAFVSLWVAAQTTTPDSKKQSSGQMQKKGMNRQTDTMMHHKMHHKMKHSRHSTKSNDSGMNDQMNTNKGNTSMNQKKNSMRSNKNKSGNSMEDSTINMPQ